jgi:hypothetical protein
MKYIFYTSNSNRGLYETENKRVEITTINRRGEKLIQQFDPKTVVFEQFNTKIFRYIAPSELVNDTMSETF